MAAASVGASAVISTVAVAGGTPAAPAPAAGAVEPPPAPEGLKGIPVPTPSNLNQFVYDKAATVRLGKALFWDMQLGSDGKTACASCHFQAGADPRSKNQVSPGLTRVSSALTPNADATFQVGGPNYQFKPEDFPFHKFADPSKKTSAVVRSHNDVASSQGVFKSVGVSAPVGASADIFTLPGDPIFTKDMLQTRQVEPRNTPTVINSVFNFRNFWDGRATYLFNGVNPFGALDANAKVYKNTGTLTPTLTQVAVRIDNASLASLATGPGLSELEMSASGRTWPMIGRRLSSVRALALQKVSDTDSVLAIKRHTTGVGLTDTYLTMVKASFLPEWWNGPQVTIGGRNFSHAEANFSLFFGLAIREYLATLVSDDSPFDRHMAGDATAMNTDARLGMALFFGKAECAQCHGGAEFTNASVRKVLKTPMSRMVMGNGATAVYDEGFYNTAVRKTLEDIANGGTNDVGKPKSLSALAQQVGSTVFQQMTGIPANVTVLPTERIAVKGAFKTPTIRNAELTAPFFHNGDSLTLEQVVQFYNRGGNHFDNNLADVDADIKPLGLTADEQRQLVVFMKATTDDRVRFRRAPFDHPELVIPNGHEVDLAGKVINDGGKAKDAAITIAAVGAAGVTLEADGFLGMGTSQLVAKHSGRCLDLSQASSTDYATVWQWDCNKSPYQRWERVPVAGGFNLRNAATGKCMDLYGSGVYKGINIQVFQLSCTGGLSQVFKLNGDNIVTAETGLCLAIQNAYPANGGVLLTASCTPMKDSMKFTRK